jgi:nucleoside transporter
MAARAAHCVLCCRPLLSEELPMATPVERHADLPSSEIATSTSEVGVVPLDLTVRAKLSVMMFFQYFTWGAWFVTLATYLATQLGCSGGQISRAYAASPIGAIIAPFVVGMIADRFFPTQYILAVLHLVGAALLVAAASVGSFTAFFPLVLLYFLCYQPTLALTNSLSFRQMSDPERQFPGVRVLGTVGWIVAGLVVGWMRIENQNTTLLIAATSSAILGLFCLALPHTPPANPGGRPTARDILGLDALAMLKQWSFAVFVIGAFLICIPLQFYYGAFNLYLNEIKFETPAAVMTLGQMCEIVFLIIMPFFFVRLGVKYMLLVGMIAWASRYVLFAYGDNGPEKWMIYLGILLHGICFDFFFVTAYIYVDKKAPSTVRAAAQGFITLVTWGVSGLIGSLVWGWTADYYTVDGVRDWRHFWLVPAIAAGAVTLVFAMLFRDRVDDTATSDAR